VFGKKVLELVDKFQKEPKLKDKKNTFSNENFSIRGKWLFCEEVFGTYA
jgi:hypothetical protein